MMASSSSTHKHRHRHCHLDIPSPFHGGATAAPPPTPSTQSTPFSTTNATPDALSRLLHSLPPSLSLSLPKRLTSQQQRTITTTTVPFISLSDDIQENTRKLQENLLSASTEQQGFFQLINHGITSELASSAELECLSLFDLTKEQKEFYFPKNWPLGFNDHDDDDQENESETTESFCTDVAAYKAELKFSSLKEFSISMEKLGKKVVEMVLRSVGFESCPFKDDPTRVCSLMWVSHEVDYKPDFSGGFYPYVVGLQYQIRAQQKYRLLSDSGWVSVSPQVDSVLVTLGDIAHVWSNGKLKQVGGRPVACSGDGEKSRCISMFLLVTLPINNDIMVSPLRTDEEDALRQESDDDNNENEDEGKNNIDEKQDDQQDGSKFKPFSFDDYAWRVYHERILFKDPLDRYRI